MTTRILSLPKISDPRGNLSFLEDNAQVPFAIHSVTWIYDIPGGTERDATADNDSDAFIVALSGSFDVVTKESRQFMHRPDRGLLIPRGTEYQLQNISTNSVVVMASSGSEVKDFTHKENLKLPNVYDCGIVTVNKHCSNRQGNYSIIENQREIHFNTKRVYYVYDVPGGESRGGHAHRACYELLLAPCGSYSVTLDDGNTKKTFMLNRPNQGLLIKPGIWRTLEDFSSGSVCMVLASEKYDEGDYIRDYDDFLNYRKVPNI